jgi:hypothetical protein
MGYDDVIDRAICATHSCTDHPEREPRFGPSGRYGTPASSLPRPPREGTMSSSRSQAPPTSHS